MLTNIVGAWEPIPKDYNFEDDFDAPKKLFWVEYKKEEHFWTNEELWQKQSCCNLVDLDGGKYCVRCINQNRSCFNLVDLDEGKYWFQNPGLKILAFAWVTGPSWEIEEKIYSRMGEPKE